MMKSMLGSISTWTEWKFRWIVNGMQMDKDTGLLEIEMMNESPFES